MKNKTLTLLFAIFFVSTAIASTTDDKTTASIYNLPQKLKVTKIDVYADDRNDTMRIEFLFSNSNIPLMIEIPNHDYKYSQTIRKQWFTITDTTLTKEFNKKYLAQYTPKSIHCYNEISKIPYNHVVDSLLQRRAWLKQQIDSLYGEKDWDKLVDGNSQNSLLRSNKDVFRKMMEKKEEPIKGSHVMQIADKFEEFEYVNEKLKWNSPYTTCDTTLCIGLFGNDKLPYAYQNSDGVRQYFQYNKNSQIYEITEYYCLRYNDITGEYENDAPEDFPIKKGLCKYEGSNLISQQYKVRVYIENKKGEYIGKKKLEDGGTITYKYTSDQVKSPIKNKSGINMIRLLEYFDNEHYTPMKLYYGLIQPCPNLPISQKENGLKIKTNYHWTFNEKGLPTKLEAEIVEKDNDVIVYGRQDIEIPQKVIFTFEW